MVVTKNLELFLMSKLDQEEQGILEAFDSGQLKKAKDTEEIRGRHQDYAKAMMKKMHK